MSLNVFFNAPIAYCTYSKFMWLAELYCTMYILNIYDVAGRVILYILNIYDVAGRVILYF